MAAGADPLVVLVLVKGLGMGGAERLLVDQVTAGATGVRYVVGYVRPDKTHFVETLHAAGVETISLGSGRGPWPLALVSALRSLRPDIVHSHSPLPAATARVLVRMGVGGRGRHHVSTEHNRWQSHRAPTRWANAATLPLDAATWAVSEEARDSVHPDRLRSRVVTLHHGASLERIRASVDDPSASVPDREPDTTIYISVANRRPNKAHEVLLDAFAIAAGAEPSLRLWLVGQWLDTDEFTALVSTNPGKEAISVLGARPDAPALIAAADAMVFSSDHEGLPVALMEAFALGRPVVSTAVGGVPEAVRDGLEGLLVSPRDPEALAAAMVRLVREPGLLERLSAGALVRAEIFDARRARDVQVAAYRRITFGSGADRSDR